jgi:pimeloyl-ACP methyl ester carboxylesterase
MPLLHRYAPLMRALTLTGIVALAACDVPSPTDLASDAGRRLAFAADEVTTPADGPWARIIEGTTGPGSRYALYIPREWNGDAVYYAHGFRDAATPVDLRDQDQLFALRTTLGERGFAVAYSSFAENGFVVKDGAQRTHQLRGLLASALGGQPARSFLAGHSLGGGIALELAQRYPTQYDGALLMCGMVGGATLQTQYLGHVRALADVYFPGRFPGNAIAVPDGTVITLPDVVAAVSSNPAGLYAIASMSQTPLPFAPVGSVLNPSSTAFGSLVGSLYAALSFHARGINNVVDLVHGKSPFDNTDTEYSLSVPPIVPGLEPMVALANGTVGRFRMPPSAESYLEKYFEPTGVLAFPVLSIHNAFDPAVPVFHERVLLERAIATGAAGNLLQRTVPTYGHCAISAGQVAQGFLDLAGWVDTGIKPAN